MLVHGGTIRSPLTLRQEYTKLREWPDSTPFPPKSLQHAGSDASTRSNATGKLARATGPPSVALSQSLGVSSACPVSERANLCGKQKPWSEITLDVGTGVWYTWTMTYDDHTANFRRLQEAIICEQCHALNETCPHHRRGIRAALRAFWQRWASKRAQREIGRLRRQVASLHAQLSESEARLDAEIARRRFAEQDLVREKLARAGYIAATSPGKPKGRA